MHNPPQIFASGEGNVQSYPRNNGMPGLLSREPA